MANKKKNQRHLTLTDRTYIEQELVRGSNFTEIGKALRKDPSTIAKEIKLHYEIRKSSYNAHGCANCVIYCWGRAESTTQSRLESTNLSQPESANAAARLLSFKILFLLSKPDLRPIKQSFHTSFLYSCSLLS